MRPYQEVGMKPIATIGGGGVVAATAMLLSLMTTAPAHAQTVPSGSYQQSCTNAQLYGGNVTADCRRSDGSWNRTVLQDVASCYGDIVNINGQLACGRNRNWGISQFPQYGQWPGYGYAYGPSPGYGYGYAPWPGYGPSYWPGYYSGYGR
jgi:hypothetical protein